jgi:hypothetical protein
MWLERLIIRKAEKRLLPYRRQAKEVERDFSIQYNGYLPEIEKLYKRTTHWHGTGRYHYKHQNGSRYKTVCTENATNILEAILRTNGLKPHLDPWINSGGKTVSLATVRMHARAFARIHLAENETLAYELGSIKYWLRLYFVLLFVWLVTSLWSHRRFIQDTLRASFSKDVQNWASAIRKPRNKKIVSIFDIFKGDIPTSDIKGNYPVLFGVTTNPKDLIDTIPLTRKVEQRSLQPITLDMFTHLEVPLQNIKETEILLKEKGILLPLIPIEFGDVYLANEPLEKLAFS